MNPEVFVQSTILVTKDEFLKNSIFFHNGAKWKSDRTAMTKAFTSAKLKSLLHHFRGVADHFLANVNEQPIKKDTEINLLIYISHTSPENFPDPLKFDPERFMDKSSNNPNRIEAGTYLPFSQGKRACIGKLLGTMKLKCLVVSMLLKFELKKPPGFKVVTESLRGGMRFTNVPVIFEKRQ